MFTPKTYRDIVDDCLTALAGGVVAEAHVFHIGTGDYPLGSVARANGIVSVRGVSDGEARAFSAGDYGLTPDSTALQWIQGRAHPEAESTFHVSYYPKTASSTITDLNVGSVARTLVEAVSREMAELHARMAEVYRSAFLDTATARSLDLVVALLGISRIRGGRPAGIVRFSRSTPAAGEITIPVGTAVSDRKGERRYLTVEPGRIIEGETNAEVRVRAETDETAAAQKNELTLMPRPITGVESVTNEAPTAAATKDESDDELRTRARIALYGAGKATLDAIRYAVLAEGVNAVSLRDMPRGIPGEVEVVVDYDGNDEKDEADIRRAIDRTRPAGVVASYRRAGRRQVRLSIRVTLAQELLQTDQSRLVESMRQELLRYVNGLAPGEVVLRNRMVSLLMQDPRVSDVTIAVISDQPLSANGDMLIGPLDRAELNAEGVEDIQTVVAAQALAPKAEETQAAVAEVRANVCVELHEPSATLDNVRGIIRAQIEAYLAEILPGTPLDYTDFLSALENSRYTVDQDVTSLEVTHRSTGLVILVTAEQSDRLAEDEVIELVDVAVNQRESPVE